MFMLHGRLGAIAGRRDDLLAILERVANGDPMKGCRLYLVAVDEGDDDGVWVTEVWESEVAHQASLQSEQVVALVAQARPILDPDGFSQRRLAARAGIPRA